MPLIFKLIGFTINNKLYEIHNNFTGPLNMEVLKKIFINYELPLDSFNNIRFITGTEQINNLNKNIDITDEVKSILIFTQDNQTKTILANIFIKYGKESDMRLPITSQADINNSSELINPEINKPLTEEEYKIPQLTPEIIESMNKKAIKLFSDPDFTFLMKLYVKRPELFATLSQYISHGDLVIDSFGKYISLDDETKSKYEIVFKEIKKLDLNVDDNIINEKIVKYKGHLNLIIRDILCEKI
jgi:hypothetical protein